MTPRLALRCAALPNARAQSKKLPRGTQLGAVRLLCEKLFKVKVRGGQG